MKLVTKNFSEEVFNKYSKVLDQFNLSEYQSYIKEQVNIENWDQLKSALSEVVRSQSTSISLAYRYVSDSYFMICIFMSGKLFIVDDQHFDGDKKYITIAIKKLLTAQKKKKLFVWNLRHLICPILDKLTLDEVSAAIGSVYDTQIISHLVTQKKNPTLISDLYEDENSKKIRVFLETIHQNEEFYYYIPHNILRDVLIKEAVFISLMGQTYGYVATKLDQMKLLKMLQHFAVVLCDIERNSRLDYDIDQLEKTKENPFVQRLLQYSKDTNHSPLKLEYKFMNASTGRLSFHNKTKVNLMSIPKTEAVRSAFVAGDQQFLSFDMSGMEIFYAIKTYSDYLSNKKIRSDFDIYENIVQELGIQDLKRSVVKNAIIKQFYGAGKFTEAEAEVALSIETGIPQLKRELPNTIPNVIQTAEGRIIRINKIVTKYLNNIIQSEANDKMIDIIIRIWFEMKRRNLKAQIVLLLHDQIVFKCGEEEVQEVIDIFKQCNTFFPYTFKQGSNLGQV